MLVPEALHSRTSQSQPPEQLSSSLRCLTGCSLQVGGRVDIKKEIDEINFVASLTDSTVRGYDSAPYLPDAIITADKRINSEHPRTCLPCRFCLSAPAAPGHETSSTGGYACLLSLLDLMGTLRKF